MRACIQSIADKEKTLITADRAIQSARQTIAEAEAIIAKGEDIRQAQGAIEALGTRRADAEARLRSFQQAHKAVLEAKADRDAQLAEVKAEISRREERIAYYAKRAALLEDSGCPAPENATCNFLKDAVAAKDSLETLREGLNGYRTAAKTEYERLTAAFQQGEGRIYGHRRPGSGARGDCGGGSRAPAARRPRSKAGGSGNARRGAHQDHRDRGGPHPRDHEGHRGGKRSPPAVPRSPHSRRGRQSVLKREEGAGRHFTPV